MAKGGKSGGGSTGGKGGGGKGGGGKGKKGGGCLPGQIAILCLSAVEHQQVKDAFNNATVSKGGTDPCPVGFMQVELECTLAQKLIFGIAIAMQTNVRSKKAKGKKAG